LLPAAPGRRHEGRLSVRKGFRALVLAAGRGSRLRPLTEAFPKPLLPVLGRPLVAWTLERLEAAGCQVAALNLHHRDGDIPRALGDRWGSMPLVYSREEELLGTLGALGPLRELFAGQEEVVVVNGDSLCRWPLRRLLARHRRHRPAATLLLTSRGDLRSFGGGVTVDGKGLLRSLRGAGPPADGVRRRVFAGAHVLARELLERIPEGSSDFVSDLYQPLLDEGSPIRTVLTRRGWHDLGTPGRYLTAALARSRRWGIGPLGWRSPGARIHPRARVRRSVLERGAVVGTGARLDRCLLLPGAQIGEGCRLCDVVVGLDTEVPRGSHIEGRLLTAYAPDQTLPPASSRLGDLVLTPLAT
jgi:mannose-1-phosphate guanylyltransferase